MARIGIALIGGGIFIQQAHRPAVLLTPALEIKAVYSRSTKSAKEVAQHVPGGDIGVYSDDPAEGNGGFKAVLARPDVAGVIIALPIANQPEYVAAALEAGKHVLSEKPVAPNVESARELVRSYREDVGPRTGATWSVAEQFRCMPNYTLGAAEARKLGKVTGFNVVNTFLMTVDNKYFNTAWRKDPTHEGGFMLDGGVHWIAAMRMLIGPEDVAETVSGFSHTATSHLPPPDSLNGVVRTESGVSGSFVASCGSTMPPTRRYAVSCERGSVIVEMDSVTVVALDGSRNVSEVDSSRGVELEVGAWADALVAGTPDARLAPEEALADLELLQAFLKSSDAGGAPQKLGLQKVRGI